MTNTDTEWREELDTMLQQKRVAEEAKRLAEQQAKIDRINRYIEAVLDFARWLGIQGDVIEQVAKDGTREVPSILRDDYLFQFQDVVFGTIKPSQLQKHKPYTVDTAQPDQRVVNFRLFIKRVVISLDDCPVRNCTGAHVASRRVFSEKDSIRVNLDTNEGVQEFRLKLAIALEELDERIPRMAAEHADRVRLAFEQDEEAAYREKADREYVPPVEEDQPAEEVDHFAEVPRHRVIYEGTQEWRWLEFLEELRNE